MTEGETSFRVIDTAEWGRIETEPMGKKRRLWLVEPEGDPDDPGHRWLFKQVRSDGQGDRGEDWAEKAVSVIAPLLGLPCAQVEFATHRGSTVLRVG